jgi:putative NADH-flavin reductase
MRLFILGATGGVGRSVVDQALTRGHEVTAFVRSPEKLGPGRPGLTIVRGDPRAPAQLRPALAGSDAVISALGPPIPFTGRTTILGDGARATLEAMAAAAVTRLLIVSGDLQFPDGGPPRLVRVLLLRHLADDQAELERAIRASAADWTIVRPTRLTHGTRTGAYRVQVNAALSRPRAISRADVAHYLVGAAERGEHLRQMVALAR